MPPPPPQKPYRRISRPRSPPRTVLLEEPRPCLPGKLTRPSINHASEEGCGVMRDTDGLRVFLAPDLVGGSSEQSLPLVRLSTSANQDATPTEMTGFICNRNHRASVIAEIGRSPSIPTLYLRDAVALLKPLLGQTRPKSLPYFGQSPRILLEEGSECVPFNRECTIIWDSAGLRIFLAPDVDRGFVRLNGHAGKELVPYDKPVYVPSQFLFGMTGFNTTNTANCTNETTRRGPRRVRFAKVNVVHENKVTSRLYTTFLERITRDGRRKGEPSSRRGTETDNNNTGRESDSNNQRNLTPRLSQRASREIVIIPFLAWNPAGRDPAKPTVLLHLLDNINETLCDNDVKIGKLYSQTFECTKTDLLARHALLIRGNSQGGKRLLWHQMTLIDVCSKIFRRSGHIFSMFVPHPTPDHPVCRRFWGSVDEFIRVRVDSRQKATYHV
jgi:hypothetical protein